MGLKRERVLDEDPFQELLGKPAFFKADDRDEYQRLRKAFEIEMAPRNIFDAMRVKDITDKCWEERRLKRYQTELIQGALSQSLAMLFAPHYGENLEAALEAAQNLYSGNPQKVREAQNLMSLLSISPEQIEANAVHARSSSLQTLDRMSVSRESSRNRIVRDHERRLRRAEKARRRSDKVEG